MLDILDIKKIEITEEGDISFVDKNGRKHYSIELSFSPDSEFPEQIEPIIHRFTASTAITKESLLRCIDKMIIDGKELDNLKDVFNDLKIFERNRSILRGISIEL